jgi:hypothetical protein
MRDDKNMVKRRQESDTVSKHRWSAWMIVKKENLLELSSAEEEVCRKLQ